MKTFIVLAVASMLTVSAFAKHGGKLLLYHGWADQQVAPGFSIEFYKAILDASKVPEQNWVRLFMAPGMAHCAGGEGPDTFDKINHAVGWPPAPAEIAPVAKPTVTQRMKLQGTASSVSRSL